MLETIDMQNNATSKQGVAVGCNQGLVVVSQDAKIPYLYLLERKIQEEIGNNNLLEHISQKLNHYIQELEDTEQMDLQGKLNLASREKELFVAFVCVLCICGFGAKLGAAFQWEEPEWLEEAEW